MFADQAARVLYYTSDETLGSGRITPIYRRVPLQDAGPFIRVGYGDGKMAVIDCEYLIPP
jgi:hypothetical protein